MPRASLTVVALALISLSGLPAAAGALDPHLDPSVVTGGCPACHNGHGSPGSPMLGRSQKDVCLSCHDSQASVDRQKAVGALSQDARPPLITQDLSQPYAHPISDAAFSSHESKIVTCTSCHSPHRASQNRGRSSKPGDVQVSPKNPAKLQYELCLSCHSATSGGAASLTRLNDPMNRSSHPVLAVSQERSTSVRPELSGRTINCGDCHGSRGGAKGPHGSSVRGILSGAYVDVDGSSDADKSYELCWSCHDSKVVMRSSPFKEHERHVRDQKTSCGTCHDPHGSANNRALIRFGDGAQVTGVSPSISAGRLAFISDAPGSGTCYLTCHGYDHAPVSYGITTSASMGRDPAASTTRRVFPSGPGRGSLPGLPDGTRVPRTRDPGTTGGNP